MLKIPSHDMQTVIKRVLIHILCARQPLLFEVVNSMSLSLCSCYVCVIVIHHKLADAQFFMADAQFFRADAQFFAVGLL